MTITQTTWPETYKRDRARRFANSTFFRVRGGTPDPIVAVKYGKWSNNCIFGCCSFCKGLTHYGVCQTCGAVRVCSKCRKIIQKDGSTLPLAYNEETDPITHGYCHACLKTDYPDMYNDIMKKHAEREKLRYES